LVIGTNVQAYDATILVDADIGSTVLAPNGSGANLTGIMTSSTLGTLTKTFTNGEASTISLTSSVLAPVVTVTKEVPQTGTTNNNWDVNSTTENYTRLDSAAATTLNFTPDTSSASYTNKTVSIASLENGLQGIFLKDDGTKMYLIGFQNDAVLQYSLSTAYDVSTATYDSVSFSVSSQETTPSGLFFKPDGTKMYVLGYTNDTVFQYALSTAWDVSTGSYESKSFNVNSQETQAQFVHMNNNGTKMYIRGFTNNIFYQYSLSTAYDVSTASYDSVSFNPSSQGSQPLNLAFMANGSVMIIANGSNDSIYQYSLSTPYNIGTASYSSKSFSVASQDTQPNGMYITSDGKVYIAGGANNSVFQYSIPYGNLSLGTGSFATADVGKTIEANSGEFVLTATTGTYVETTAPTSYAQVASGSWSMYGVVYNTVDGDLQLSSTQINQFDVSTSVFVDAFDVASQEESPKDVAFNTDGTKMFVVGGEGDDINEYALTNGFDVSTASFTDSFSVAAQDNIPTGLAFNTDGTKMFVVGGSGDDVGEYALSTGFDVSTASFTDAFSVAAQEGIPTGVAFSTDGTKMFVVGYSSDNVNEYTLSTGFDVSTASFVDAFSVAAQETVPTGITFSTDGTKMFVVGHTGQDVNEYALTNGFDVSTASFTDSFSVSAEETHPEGLVFNTDGTKMFICGNAGNDILEYAVGTTAIPSGYNPVLTTASIDSTYWTDINSMTADQAAGDGNVYYAVSTDNRTTWSVIKDVGGERDIVKNNAGTWQYNSNGTYGSETWTNGTTNTELATLAESMGTAQNLMDKTQLDAVTDPNHIALGNDLDLSIILNLTSGSTVPSSNGVAINYDATVLNKGAILGTDYDFDAPATNKVRITSLASQNLKVRVV
jgi:DNA-binding beta-propeller fold protein YncE